MKKTGFNHQIREAHEIGVEKPQSAVPSARECYFLQTSRFVAGYIPWSLRDRGERRKGRKTRMILGNKKHSPFRGKI
jgi:hypothetical protein